MYWIKTFAATPIGSPGCDYIYIVLYVVENQRQKAFSSVLDSLRAQDGSDTGLMSRIAYAASTLATQNHLMERGRQTPILSTEKDNVDLAVDKRGCRQ